jgi:hypothetical protein
MEKDMSKENEPTNDEIEITPEMRAAGFFAVENSIGETDHEGLAIEVYIAMVRARSSQKDRSRGA